MDPNSHEVLGGGTVAERKDADPEGDPKEGLFPGKSAERVPNSPARRPSVAVVSSNPQVQTLQRLLQTYIPSIRAAIPKHLTAERVMAVAVSAAQRNPDLLKCTPASFVKSVMVASQMGLEVAPEARQAYLVPFRNTKTRQMEATLIPDYRGLLDLCRRSDQIGPVFVAVVYEQDQFDLEYGLEPKLSHRPNHEVDDRGKMTGVYALARLKGHEEPQWIYLSRREVEARKKRSRASDYGPWKTDEEAMWKKTAIRDLCNLLPRSLEIQRMISAEDAVSRGEAPDFGLDLELPGEEPQNPLDALADPQEDGRKTRSDLIQAIRQFPESRIDEACAAHEVESLAKCSVPTLQSILDSLR